MGRSKPWDEDDAGGWLAEKDDSMVASWAERDTSMCA